MFRGSFGKEILLIKSVLQEGSLISESFSNWSFPQNNNDLIFDPSPTPNCRRRLCMGPLIQDLLKEQIFEKFSPQIHMGSGGPNFKSIVDDTIRARKRYCKLNCQRYTYRVLQTIHMKLILLCVWAEPAVLGSTKTGLKFKYEIQIG